MAIDSDILFEHRGFAGIVTLNRPQGMNAVTHGMVRALAASWASGARPCGHRVIIKSRRAAFSAGANPALMISAGRADAKPCILPDKYCS